MCTKTVKLKQPNICINTDCVMLLTLEACLAYFLKCFPKITDKFLTSICNSVGNALNDKGRCSSNWRLIPLQILPWGNFQRILRDFLNKKDTRVVFGDKNCLAIRPDCRIREKLCNRTIHFTRAILDAEARLGECNGSVIMCTCLAFREQDLILVRNPEVVVYSALPQTETITTFPV